MKKNELTFRVFGKYALFTDPVTKIGGEKCTLMIPPYAAMVGICESIYWKPSIRWIVTQVRVIKEIRTESKGIRPVNYGGGNDLCMYAYLADVEYQVRCHFEFNLQRKDLEQDWNENKHYFIGKRSLERGGRRDVCMGARECQAYVEPVVFGEGEGYYDESGDIEFGFQYHSLQYPDQHVDETLTANFWSPKMQNGIIDYCRPVDCPRKHTIKKGKKKLFIPGKNFTGTKEEGILEGYGLEGDIY